jgi:hypothetical protein
MAKRAKRASTRDVLADLIERPPLNEGELARRLRDLDPAEGRREIVDRLFAGSAPRDSLEMLAAALLHLGIGGQEARLERIAADARRGRPERWTALSLVFSASPERANALLVDLGPQDGLRLMLQPAAQAIAYVVAEPEAGDAIAEALAALPHEMRPEAIAYLEEVRRSAGTPAILAYRELLQREGLADLRDPVLQAIVDEGGAEAGAELVTLRDEAEDPGARQAFQRALLRLGTRAIEAPSAPVTVQGEAHLGICDGQGAFVLLGCFTNADGSTSIADLCIRAGGEVRDGFAAAALDEGEVASFFARMRESGLGDLAPLTLAEGAAVAFAGVERSRRAGIPVPDDARPAVLLFERARAAGAAGEGARPEGDLAAPALGPVTLADARALLALPYYGSWFFDAGDLGGAGVSLPGQGGGAGDGPRSSKRGGAAKRAASPRRRKPRPEWFEAALVQLEGSEVAPRLRAMLAHMARWHALRGEAGPAGVCAAARAEAEASFHTGALPRAMLDRGVQVLQAHAGERTGVVGDPDARDRIRVELFHDVNEPKGKDLAALDPTEAALVALTSALDELPGSRRPREESLLHAAFAVGCAFARWVLARRRSGPEPLLEEMGQSLVEILALTPPERDAVVGLVLPALATFVGEVCDQCPVGCLNRPKADVADAFFAVKHPAFG